MRKIPLGIMVTWGEIALHDPPRSIGHAQQVEFITKTHILASGIGDLALNHSPGKDSKHGIRFHLGGSEPLSYIWRGRDQTSISTVGEGEEREAMVRGPACSSVLGISQQLAFGVGGRALICDLTGFPWHQYFQHRQFSMRGHWAHKIKKIYISSGLFLAGISWLNTPVSVL